MQMDSIRLFRVPLEPAGAKDDPRTRVESIYVSLQSGDQNAFGEVTLPAAPVDSVEWSAGAFCCLRDWLAPAVVGRSIDSSEALQDVLGAYRGNLAAKSALDIAWWNLAAEQRRITLYKTLGGTRIPVPLSATLEVTESIDKLLTNVQDALAAGYEHVTLKIRPGWDVEVLRVVRQKFPTQPLAVDCNGQYALARQEMFFRLEDFFLQYIEQPLAADDLVGHAMIQESLRTPIALDESITSLARLEQAIDLGSCRIVRIHPARVGGITPALAIHKACSVANIPCWIGTAGAQGGVAASACAALASVCEGALPDEAFSWRAQSWLMTDDTTLTEKNAGGMLQVDPSSESFPPSAIVDQQVLADAAAEEATLG